MHIGDPTILGWLTVAVYLLASALCFLCARQAWHGKSSDDRVKRILFWGGLAAGMFFLGINKQLDLQTWILQAGREKVQAAGLQDYSQAIQVALIAGMALAAFTGLLILLWWLRGQWRYTLAALLGALFLARFFVVRAAGFVGVSLPQMSRFTGGIRINYLLEITGAAVIALAALYNLSHKPSK